jgi:hypothetical protein
MSRFALLPLLFALATGPTNAGENDLSAAQVRALAHEIVTHTPEHVHWAKGTHFAWVLLAQPAPDLFPDVTAAVRALLAERYTVYDDEASVPPEYRSTDEIGITYVSGFLFHFEVRILRPGVVEVTYSDFESSLAGSRQTVSYRWRRGRWTTLFRGRVFVA